MLADTDGDGLHEFCAYTRQGEGTVVDEQGRALGAFKGLAAMASKFVEHPGEQLLTFDRGGTVCTWANRSARDTPAGRERWAHPFYRANRRLFAVGYNLNVLGGI